MWPRQQPSGKAVHCEPISPLVLLSLGNHQKLKLEGYLAVEVPNLHKFEQGKCGTLVENQSVILKVVGSNPGTIYFEESELCVL